MQAVRSQLKNVKLAHIVVRVLRILMVKENAGLGTIVRQTHQSPYLQIQDSFLKDLEMKNRNRVVLAHSRTSMVQLNANNVQRAANVLTNK
jgi:hypothetical protein